MNKRHIGSNAKDMIKAWERRDPGFRADMLKARIRKGHYSVIWSKEDKEYVGPR